MTDIARKEHVEDADRLAERFEAARPRLLRMAQRMLGSASESDDALQESWLRIAHADTESLANFDAWLTTVVSRVCLDALNWRSSRREDLTPDDPRRDVLATAPGERPEEEALLADSIGVALLVLLDALPPAERVAYVLHDMFDVPFETIAASLRRSTEAARKLASRARRRVRGASTKHDATAQRNDELVRAFLAASRAGHFGALLSLLDPAATLHADATVMAMGGGHYFEQDGMGGGIYGSHAVAQMFTKRAAGAQAVFIDRQPGAVWRDGGEIRVMFVFTVANDRVATIGLIADPAMIAQSVIERDFGPEA